MKFKTVLDIPTLNRNTLNKEAVNVKLGCVISDSGELRSRSSLYKIQCCVQLYSLVFPGG